MAPRNFNCASLTLSFALNLPISAAPSISSLNYMTETLPLSPLHGSTRFATHISFVAVAIPRICYKLFRPLNRLTPNDPYMSHTAPLTPKHCILYIYSTNIGTEYFKHALYSPFFSLQSAVCFIILICLVPVLFTFYIQVVLKLKK